MRRLFLLVIAATSLTLQSQTLQHEQARRQAATFLNAVRNNPTTITPDQLKLAGESEGCCLFNATSGGWAITKGKGDEVRVLAYNDSGNLDGEQLPGSIQAWLKAYSEQDMVKGEVIYTDERIEIAPMLRTHWGQDAPYNNLCPLVPGEDGETMVHAAAGCANVAVAQLMNYHQWPRSCDEVTYKWLGYPGVEPQDHGTLPATVFNWDAMNEDNDNGWSEVAKLLQYIGYANSTIYGWKASTTYAQRIINTLTAFGYDAVQTGFDIYNNEPFLDDAIYQELRTRRPVLLSVYAIENDDSHICVVDGYSKDGFYHINWGWKGHGDGYFVLPTSHVATEDFSTRFSVQTMISAKIKDDYAAVSVTHLNKTIDNTFFDMQGRRLNGQPRHGLYIRDGRKYVVR